MFHPLPHNCNATIAELAAVYTEWVGVDTFSGG